MGTIQRNMAQRIDVHGLQNRSRRKKYEFSKVDGVRKVNYVNYTPDESEKGWRVMDASGELLFSGTFKRCLDLRVDGQTVERERISYGI